jgi:hypothetical protein
MLDYTKEATRTEAVDLFKVDNSRILHAAIGASTEVAELILAESGDITNVKEEMGDILWYVAIAADALGLDCIEDFLPLADQTRVDLDAVKAMVGAAADALDVVKRGLFYGIDLDEVKFGSHFGTLLEAVQLIAKKSGWTLNDLKEANIAKLSKRYPEKFTSEKAVNRDTVTEMEAVGA